MSGEVGVTVRMTREQHEALKARAASEHRTLAQELRRLVDLSLAADDADKSDLPAAA